MYHGYWRDCGGISDHEVCFLAILKSGGRFVQRSRNTKLGQNRSDTELTRTHLRTIWWDFIEKSREWPINRSLDRRSCSISLENV
jgi:hypothetical protein